MLQKNNRRKLRGVLLIPDMLVGLVVAGMVIAAAITAYITISQMWQDDLVMNELSGSANIAVERMLHGTDEINMGLLAAKVITSPASGATANSVTYTDYFNTTRRFYYSAGKLYAAVGAAAGTSILSNVVSAAFFYNGKMVHITLALRKASGRKEINLSVETQANVRN